MGEHGPQHRQQMGQHSPKMGQPRESGRIFAMPVPGSRKISEATSLATGESVSRVNSQHDPKTIQMDLMMGREAARDADPSSDAWEAFPG